MENCGAINGDTCSLDYSSCNLEVQSLPKVPNRYHLTWFNRPQNSSGIGSQGPPQAEAENPDLRLAWMVAKGLEGSGSRVYLGMSLGHPKGWGDLGLAG